jgi:hypothetical protein
MTHKRMILICGAVLMTMIWGYGCGGRMDSSSVPDDSGAVSFTIGWPDTGSDSKSDVGTRCMNGTVQNITIGVYDGDGRLLVDMDDATFDCSEGKGVVDNVPSGIAIRLVVLATGTVGYSTAEAVYLRGEYPDIITVERGKTTLLGTIDASGFVPGLSHPVSSEVVTKAGLQFEWTPVIGGARYKISVSKVGSSITRDYYSAETFFAPPTSDESYYTTYTSYEWTVTAIDAYGNQGVRSTIGYFVLM